MKDAIEKEQFESPLQLERWTRTIQREGDDLTIELPDDLCDELLIDDGTVLTLRRRGDGIVVYVPLWQRWRTRLRRLLGLGSQ